MASELNERDKNAIYECISELVEMERKEEIRAVAIAVVRSDGSVRTLMALAEGGWRLHLVAAGALVQHETLSTLQVSRDPDNYLHVKD